VHYLSLVTSDFLREETPRLGRLLVGPLEIRLEQKASETFKKLVVPVENDRVPRLASIDVLEGWEKRDRL
jgi:hypothetical protein